MSKKVKFPVHLIKMEEVLQLYGADPLENNPWSKGNITKNSITIAIRDKDFVKSQPSASAELDQHVKHIAWLTTQDPMSPVEIELMSNTKRDQVWGGIHSLVAATYLKSKSVVCCVLGEYPLVNKFLKFAKVPNTRSRKV